MQHGILAELTTPEQLLETLRALRQHGYERVDAFTPYIMPELEELVPGHRSRLPWITAIAGFGAAGLAYSLQWLANAVWYPLNVGGRPPNSIPAFMIITFVFGILCAGPVTLYAFFKYADMPWLANPIFAAEGFERATLDRFWVSIAAADPKFDRERTARELHALGAQRIQFVSPKAARPWLPDEAGSP